MMSKQLAATRNTPFVATAETEALKTMKAVIQRVLSATVTVNNEVVSSIGKGMLVLVAVSPTDSAKDGEGLARKLIGLKMWPAENKPWAQSVKDISGEILCVSQFTLFANINKGSKPDFHGSASPDIARPLYDQFIETMRKIYVSDQVKDGVFGAMMQVALVNDGPVTFDFDTAKSGNVSAQKQKEGKKQKWEERKAAGKNTQVDRHIEKENETVVGNQALGQVGGFSTEDNTQSLDMEKQN